MWPEPVERIARELRAAAIDATIQEFPEGTPTADAAARAIGCRLEQIVKWVLHSHEHFDGSGYPDGLAGEMIPAASRILLTADAFDAMTSDRPYRRALSVEAALVELERHAGTQFDASCVAALVAAVGAPSRESNGAVPSVTLGPDRKASTSSELEAAPTAG